MASRSRKALTLFDDYHEMMSDRVRLDAYRDAISRTIRPGDVVVDLGAGLGILSFLAVQAGASRVYAIEKGDAARLARAVARRNGLEDRITFLEQHSLDVELDTPADVLLSETLGSFALDENTLAFTIDARERLLRPGGRMIPRRLEPWLAPVQLPEQHARVAFWNDVAGLDFSPAIDEMLGRMGLATVRPKQLMADAQSLGAIDLATTREATVASRHLFELQRAGTVHGLAGWFSAELCDGVQISTSPTDPATHWQQAFFPFREPVRVVRGDMMEVTFQIGPKSERADDTSVRYDFRCTQLANERAQAPPSRSSPCPCGSGKKYKRCCGAA